MEIKKIIENYRNVIPYLFFGVCTTLVNVIIYWIAAHLFGIVTMISTIIAWILAVLFAYFTNRKWVFNSSATSIEEIRKEIIYFYSCRIATGIVDWGCMFVFVKVLEINDLVVKIGANFLVIILNYLASKFIIFKGSEK